MAGLDSDVRSLVVHINYDSRRDAFAMRVEEEHSVNTILLRQKRRVVIIGEGNFSFSVVLAAMRRSWQGVLATQLKSTAKQPFPEYTDIQHLAARECVDVTKARAVSTMRDADPLGATAKRHLCRDMVHSLDYLQALYELPPPMTDTAADLSTFQDKVDATRLELGVYDDLFSSVVDTVIFYQCPWSDGGYYDGAVRRLLKSFVRSASRRQRNGEYLFVGVTTCWPYVKSYGLQELLGRNLFTASGGSECSSRSGISPIVHGEGFIASQGYDFLGVDTTFMQAMVHGGYRHEGKKDIHAQIRDCHVTLCFRKGFDLS